MARSEIEQLNAALRSRTQAMASACTRCGDCVRACPMPDAAGETRGEPRAVIDGVLDLLAGAAGSAASRRWAELCSGTGACISACPEDLNPRFMLAMTRLALKTQDRPESARRAEGRLGFKKMARGLSVLSRLQMDPQTLERLSPGRPPQRESAPDLVFYTGCNLAKTPHIGLLCLDILDRLDVRYEVQGGAASCCGVFQTRSGDVDNALRQGVRTLDKLAATGAAQVVSWCPTCQIQFEETTAPVRVAARDDGGGRQPTPFDLTMFPLFLRSRLAKLRPHLTHTVDKRVAVHGHPGSAGVTAAVTDILRAVPGVEVVDLAQAGIGYTLTSLNPVPERRKALLRDTLAAAEAAGVHMLAGIYHSDHRELASHEGEWPFHIGNFLEIVGESMGVSHEDVFQRLKIMQDADRIVDECADLIETHGLDVAEVREVVLNDMLGEQFLPLKRAGAA